MKTAIRIGVDGTKKNEKFHVSDRTTGTRKKTKNLRKKRKMEALEKDATNAEIHEKSTKKTKNENHPKGHHKGANARKIYEKRKIIQEASKAYTNEKSTKKNEKLCVSKDPTPIGRKINATNPGPLKILEETKKTKNFSFSRKIHEKSQCKREKLTKNDMSC